MLRVGGLTRCSASDYPGKLAAVVFCQGCAWRCGYCHNPELQPRRGRAQIPWRDVLAFLDKRRGLLDAVVFSGGEPTLQSGLAAAMREVKAMGYLVGLHTAGIVPRRLAEVLPLVDWVAMDVKAPLADHERVTGVRGSAHRARRSLDLIVASRVARELHTLAPAQLEARGGDSGESATAIALRRRQAHQSTIEVRNAGRSADLNGEHRNRAAVEAPDREADRVVRPMLG